MSFCYTVFYKCQNVSLGTKIIHTGRVHRIHPPFAFRIRVWDYPLPLPSCPILEAILFLLPHVHYWKLPPSSSLMSTIGSYPLPPPSYPLLEATPFLLPQ